MESLFPNRSHCLMFIEFSQSQTRSLGPRKGVGAATQRTRKAELCLLLIRESKRKLTFYSFSSQSLQKNYEIFSRSNTEVLHKGCHNALICRSFTLLSCCTKMRGQLLSSLRGRCRALHPFSQLSSSPPLGSPQ